VWHCDGDVRPILDMLLECGVRGLQGFQPECGMTIDFVASKRTREGDPLLVFGPLAVTTELPFCTPDEIRAKVRHAVEVCQGNADLVMFTGNTINRTYRWRTSGRCTRRRRAYSFGAGPVDSLTRACTGAISALADRWQLP